MSTELLKLLEARATAEWVALSHTLAQQAALSVDSTYWFAAAIWDDLRAWLIELRGTIQEPI